MASLTTCLKKAGAFLPAEDRAAILAAAQESRASGMKAGEAGRAAVLARLEAVRQELAAAEQRLQQAEAGRAQPAAEPAAPAPADLAEQLDMLLREQGGTLPQQLDGAPPADRMAAVAMQFPDLQVMVDGMEKPMPMAEFLAAAKAEADDLAADAPLVQAAAECALLQGF